MLYSSVACHGLFFFFLRDLYGLVLSSSQRPSTTLLGASVPCTSALHDTHQEFGLHSFDLQRASGWKGRSAELLKAGAEALPHTALRRQNAARGYPGGLGSACACEPRHSSPDPDHDLCPSLPSLVLQEDGHPPGTRKTSMGKGAEREAGSWSLVGRGGPAPVSS